MLNIARPAKKFGLYIHIPYCVQRCSYCDFTTYEKSQIAPIADYMQTLRKELFTKAPTMGSRSLHSIYFGGGTPSLVPAQDLANFLNDIRSQFFVNTETEITLEINPATINEESLEIYLKAGFNRFSVGAQTFDDALLKKLGRIHNSQDTLKTLYLLKSRDLNYNFDILFALPGQNIEGLKRDLDQVATLAPNHVSPYCLTLKSKHPLEVGRPSEEAQIQMFDLIESSLIENGYHRYEISNFAKPGFESRHNSLYWSDDDYWGLGVSAHSYLSQLGPWGSRFWNAGSFQEYMSEKWVPALQLEQWLGNFPDRWERLQLHESLTDFLHVSLRTAEGLSLERLGAKFPSRVVTGVEEKLAALKAQTLLKQNGSIWTLSPGGVKLSNLVFEKLAFLEPLLNEHTEPS